MRFNLISNINNGGGLQRDYEILRRELEARGHEVFGVQFNAPKPQKADINLFLETVVAEAFPFAAQQWVIPNPEWWFPRYNTYLPKFSRVLCKTRDGLRLFKPLVGTRATFLGFMGQDRWQPEVHRDHSFIHVAGNSMVKNTEAVITAWCRIDRPLTVVTGLPRWITMAKKSRSVSVVSKIPEATLTTLMNQNFFHICPSKYEGFGHYLHEAQSMGAIILTGNGPPMTEFDTPTDLLIPMVPESTLRLATLNRADPGAVVQVVRHALTLSDETLASYSRAARAAFEQRQVTFRANLTALLESP